MEGKNGVLYYVGFVAGVCPEGYVRFYRDITGTGIASFNKTLLSAVYSAATNRTTITVTVGGMTPYAYPGWTYRDVSTGNTYTIETNGSNTFIVIGDASGEAGLALVSIAYVTVVTDVDNQPPGIADDRDGHLIVVAIGDGNILLVYRSLDDGYTWSLMGSHALP